MGALQVSLVTTTDGIFQVSLDNVAVLVQFYAFTAVLDTLCLFISHIVIMHSQLG